MKPRALFIGRLTLPWLLIGRLSPGVKRVFFAGESALVRKLRPKLSAQFQRVKYADMPGSYYVAEKLLYVLCEELYDHELLGSRLENQLKRLLQSEKAEALLRKSVVMRATNETFRQLFLYHQLPRLRAYDCRYVASDLRLAETILSLPSGTGLAPVKFSRLSRAIDRLKQLATKLALSVYVLGFALRRMSRGIVRQAEPLKYAWGRTWTNPSLSTRAEWDAIFDSKSPLTSLESRNCLTLFRRGLDADTRDYLESNGLPYLDLPAEKVPVRLLGLLARAGLAMVVDLLTLRWRRYPASVIKGYVGAVRDIVKAEIELSRVDVAALVETAEYSMHSQIFTVILNRRGGRTFGYMHGDYLDHFPAYYYPYVNNYAVWGPYYTALHGPAWRFVDEITVTGSYFMERALGYMQTKVKADYLPWQHTDKLLVVAFGTSYAEDIFSQQQDVINFYQALAELAKRRPDIYIVARPKYDEFDSEPFRSMTRELTASGRLIIEPPSSGVDSYLLMAIADLVVVHQLCSIGSEALAVGKKVLYYDYSAFPDFPYERYSDLLIARSDTQFFKRVDRILAGEWLSPETQESIRSKHNEWTSGGLAAWRRQIESSVKRHELTPEQPPAIMLFKH